MSWNRIAVSLLFLISAAIGNVGQAVNCPTPATWQAFVTGVPSDVAIFQKLFTACGNCSHSATSSGESAQPGSYCAPRIFLTCGNIQASINEEGRVEVGFVIPGNVTVNNVPPKTPPTYKTLMLFDTDNGVVKSGTAAECGSCHKSAASPAGAFQEIPVQPAGPHGYPCIRVNCGHDCTFRNCRYESSITGCCHILSGRAVAKAGRRLGPARGSAMSRRDLGDAAEHRRHLTAKFR